MTVPAASLRFRLQQEFKSATRSEWVNRAETERSCNRVRDGDFGFTSYNWASKREPDVGASLTGRLWPVRGPRMTLRLRRSLETSAELNLKRGKMGSLQSSSSSSSSKSAPAACPEAPPPSPSNFTKSSASTDHPAAGAGAFAAAPTCGRFWNMSRRLTRGSGSCFAASRLGCFCAATSLDVAATTVL